MVKRQNRKLNNITDVVLRQALPVTRSASSGGLGVLAAQAFANAYGWDRLVRDVGTGTVKLGRKATSWFLSSGPNGASGPSISPFPAMPPTSYATQYRGSTKWDGSITIEHRELVTTLTAAQYRSFVVNPSNANLFPYLSVLAKNFETYEFKKLQFDVVTGQSTNTSGTYWMALDPDSLDILPTGSGPNITKTQAMAFRDSLSSPVWQNGCLVVQPSTYKTKTKPFIGGTTIDDNYGSFVLNLDTAATIDFFVEYTVTLKDPHTDNDTSSFTMVNASTTNWSNTGAFDQFDGDSLINPRAVAKSFAVNAPGYYVVELYVGGTTVTGINGVAYGGGISPLANRGALEATKGHWQFVFQVTSLISATVTFTYATTGTEIYKLQVYKVPQAVYNLLV